MVRLKYWPRRAPGLPPGQRRLDAFPRFSAEPRRRPPSGRPDSLALVAGGVSVEVAHADIAALGTVRRVHDFHCVTTWSHVGVAWEGVPLRDVWSHLVSPRLGERANAPFVVATAADRYRAVFRADDLLAPDVLLAFGIDGAPLDDRHGAPIRLVSPSQYGYKSVKHLTGFELHTSRPRSRLGAIEHLRARVALEERHGRIPGRLLRLPYRTLIGPTAGMAERSLRSGVAE